MAEKEGKKEEEKLEFTAEGETPSYISLDQARVLALQHARDNREFYGRYADRELLWQVVDASETEDYYEVRLSYHPAHGFHGRPGVEQFTIEKTGPIEFRQILSQPVDRRRTWVTTAVVSVIVVVAVGVVGGLLASGVLTGEESPVAITLFGAWVPVEPDSPATLEFPDGDIVVTVPEASVERPVGLRFSSVSGDQIPPLPQGYVASSYFDLSVVPDPDGEPIRFAFLKPITVEIALSTADIALAGGVESNVVVQHFVDDEWIPLPTTVGFRDATAQVEVESLSLFALTIWERPIIPVPVLASTATLPPSPTPVPTPAPTAATIPIPTPTATAVPVPTPVPAATPVPLATAIPVPTPAPVPTPTPTPVVEYLLETAIGPEDGGSVQAVPESDDGRYPSGTTVAVTARCNLGFVSWAGDVPEGASPYDNPVTVSMHRDLVLVAICVGPTPVPATPTATPVVPTPTPEPRYAVSINGFAIGPGQSTLAVGNGIIVLSQPPDAEGTYVRNTELTLVADTGGIEALVFWSGVASESGYQATVLMAGPRSISVVIIPSRQPTPTATPLPQLEVPGSLPPTATPVPVPTPTPTPTPTLAPGVTPTITPTPTPTPASVDRPIAFRSDRDGNAEIYVMSADGSNQTRLTTNGAYDGGPSWSANGSKIAFTSDRDGNNEIYVMNSNGTGVVRLTVSVGRDEEAAWSRDGAQIAFRSTRDGTEEIYVMSADGSNVSRLTNNGFNDASPSWCPDGRIVFASFREGSWDIYVMNGDGTGEMQLTSAGGHQNQPACSPNGSTIAYSNGAELYTMNADGSNQAQVDVAAFRNMDSWSSDGSKMLIRTNRDGNEEIYVMNGNGSSQTRLTNNGAFDGEADWRP